MATVNNIDIDTDRFWREGYLMLRNLFAPDEIARLREQVLLSMREREASGAEQVDALGNPRLAPYVCDERLISVARHLLGSQEIAYYGDASYAVVGHNYQPGIDVGGWHRDNTDRSDTSLPDWNGKYSLIRFGLYLQDHRYNSGGLILRRTTHDRIVRGLPAHLTDRYLNNGPGDISVWSMRIQHAGLGRCVRGMPWLGVGPYWQKVLPEFMQAPFGQEERAGFWVSYALDDDHLRRHCDYLLGRKERLSMWKESHYTAETLEACQRVGLKVVDMPGRMRAALAKGEAVGTHHHHYQVAASDRPTANP